jgi:hypothetical protein
VLTAVDWDGVNAGTGCDTCWIGSEVSVSTGKTKTKPWDDGAQPAGSSGSAAIHRESPGYPALSDSG